MKYLVKYGIYYDKTKKDKDYSTLLNIINGGKKMKKILSLILTMVMIFSLSACSGGSKTSSSDTTKTTNQKTIKIGFLVPITGPSAKQGKEAIKTAEMMRDIINNKTEGINLPLAITEGLPNLAGAKIELVFADHKGSPEVTLAETERLITEEKCVAIAGVFNSAQTKTAAVAAEKLKVPLLTSGTSPQLTEKGLKWLFRFGLNDSTFIEDTYKFMKELNETKNAGIKTVATISEDTEFGANIVKEEEKNSKKYGYEIVEKIIYPANATNLTAEVLRLKKSNPDVVIMASYTSDTILLIKTFKELNFNPKLIIGQRGGFMVSEFFTALGADSENLMTTSAWNEDLANPVIKQVYDHYSKLSGGIPMTGDITRDVNNILLISMAINQAGSTDSEKIREAFLNLKYPKEQMLLPWEGIKLDGNNQNTQANGIIVQVQGGKYKTVYPTALKSVDLKYPIPTWSERK